MTQRDSAHATFLTALTLDGSTCEHCHLHYLWRDGSSKHATVEVETAWDGSWTAYCALRRPNPTNPSRMDDVVHETKYGHATAADAIAAIFDGPSALWPQPKEGGKEGKA